MKTDLEGLKNNVMAKSIEQKIFDLLHKTGEIDTGSVHIIDSSDQYKEHEDCARYRVYHRSGYCIDVEKSVEDYDPQKDMVTKWYYGVYQEWPEFATINEEKLYALLKKDLK